MFPRVFHSREEKLFLSFSFIIINYFHARYPNDPINFSLHRSRESISRWFVPQVSTGWSASISSNTMRNGRTSTSVVYGRGRQTTRSWRRIVAISAWLHPRPFIPPTSRAWWTCTGRSRPSTSPIPSPTWVGSFRWLLSLTFYFSSTVNDNNTNNTGLIQQLHAIVSIFQAQSSIDKDFSTLLIGNDLWVYESHEQSIVF